MMCHRFALLVFLALCTLAGCATIERDQALHKEEMLAGSGFEKKLAESAEQQSELRRLPSHMLVRVPRGSETAYVYADAETCRCLYVGSERAYEVFLAALTQEYIQGESASNADPLAPPAPEEVARYENLARETNLDTKADVSVDWDLWD